MSMIRTPKQPYSLWEEHINQTSKSDLNQRSYQVLSFTNNFKDIGNQEPRSRKIKDIKGGSPSLILTQNNRWTPNMKYTGLPHVAEGGFNCENPHLIFQRVPELTWYSPASHAS
jgi:hypothetical protein